jgi:beta-lactam-binding protein with PASTA domain
MKSFFRLVLVALVLLVVALLSALTAMRFAIHGQEVAVPNLVGKTPSEAFRIAEESGLPVIVERQFYSANIPEGKIMSQVPEAGSQVRRGWQVRVAESLGPQRAEIPNVLGESDRAAEINILRRGLDLAAVAQIQLLGATPSQVVAQSPPPNASGVSAPKISLLVTEAQPAPAFVMPNFVGQPLGSVSNALQDAGMRLGVISTAAQPPAPDGQVPAPGPTTEEQFLPASVIVSQNPAPGQKVLGGTAVNFEVR